MADPPAVGPPRYRPQRRNVPVARRWSRCPSLVELATGAVVANINICVMASRERWSTLPTRILLDIYERLLSKDHNPDELLSLTLDAWSILSATLFAQGAEVKRSVHHHTTRVPPPSPGAPSDHRSFTLCFGPAWSPDPSFITHLTLDRTCELHTANLLLLPDMPNLGLLRIVEPREPFLSRPRVTDRVIRAWSERANPFPALRILQLSCCIELTPECLRYLAALPVLVYITVRGRLKHWNLGAVYETAPEHGWRVPEDPDDVRALMRRYFASCLGLRDGLPARLELAARLVSKGKPAGLSRLFDDVSTTNFNKRPAVLPWEGSVPSDGWDRRGLEGIEDADDLETTDDRAPENMKDLPLGETVTMYDNPMWWLYAAVGHVILRDRDTGSVGGVSREVPTSNGWVLPSLPVLSLTMAPRDLGPEARWVADDDLVKCKFVRQAAFEDVAARETPWVLAKAAPSPQERGGGTGTGSARTRRDEVALRQRKRRKMGDLLSSMAGG